MEKKQKRRFLRAGVLIVLFAAIIYAVYGTVTKDNKGMLEVGDDAPDFNLVDLQGNEVHLSDFAKEGKGVFLNFWGTWCEPCEREMPAMERQYNAYKGQDFEMIAVNNAESDFAVSNYVKQQGMTFPVVIDKNRSVQDAYNIIPLPTTILISPEGKIQQIVKGEMNDQSIAKYIESILPKE